MEIKILCPCGAKFKFDVEPVDGKSPGTVLCPACGTDRTEATNAAIQEKLSQSAPAVPAAPTVPKVSVSAPAPAPVSSAAGGPRIAIPAVRIPGAAAATPGPAPLAASAGMAPSSP